MMRKTSAMATNTTLKKKTTKKPTSTLVERMLSPMRLFSQADSKSLMKVVSAGMIDGVSTQQLD